MHKYRSTNVFALLIVTIVGASLAWIILSKINYSYDVETAHVQNLRATQPSNTAANDTAVQTFNMLVAQAWKAYRNEDMNIEFAYPSDWSLTVYEKSISIRPKIFKKNNGFDELGFYVEIFKNENLNRESPSQWEQENIDVKALEDQISNKEIQINSYPAYYAVYNPSRSELLEGEDFFDNLSIDIFKGDDIYTISGSKLWATSDDGIGQSDLQIAQQYQSDFDQILASFHFLK